MSEGGASAASSVASSAAPGSPRTILVTGGTGKTGSRVAQLIAARGAHARVATRRPRAADEPSQPGRPSQPSQQIRFEWSDAASYAAALDGVSAIYLVAPSNVAEPLAAMRPLLDRALHQGVARLVLLSSSMLEEGGPMMGAVHAYLRAQAPGWTVLRPSWFMQNFSEPQHGESIRREGRIYSATEDGRVPFIDAGDIAAVAARALTDEAFGNGELILTGPEAISYDQAARTIATAAGRSVVHHRLDVAALAARFAGLGIGQGYARMLAEMDVAIAAGAEARVTDEVERVTGKAATSFADFADRHVASWR